MDGKQHNYQVVDRSPRPAERAEECWAKSKLNLPAKIF